MPARYFFAFPIHCVVICRKHVLSLIFLLVYYIINLGAFTTFQDLKKHNFYYWFAFPASVKTIATTTDSSGGTKVDQLLSAEELLTLNQTYFAIGDPKNRAFFVIERSGGKLVHKTLAEAISTTNIQSNFRDYSEDAIWFGFSDPSCFENAGWPARSFLGMLAVFWFV